jgi:putative transposase
MEVSDAMWLKAREEENADLKNLLAESMLDVSTLREMLGKTSEDEPCRAIGPSDNDDCSRRSAVNWAITEKG